MPAEKNVKVIWRGNLAFEGAAGSTDRTIPLNSGDTGADGGFRPMELLLVGLAGCTGMDVISILGKKQQEVTGFEVEVRGVQAEDFPKVFEHITVTYRVTGRSIDPAAVARSIELSETKYCSVWAMLKERAEITSLYEITEAEPA